MTNKKKVKARDVQAQTGWSYRFTGFLIQQLGYGVVSDEVDRVIEAGGDLAALNETLAKRARDAQRAKRSTDQPVAGVPDGWRQVTADRFERRDFVLRADTFHQGARVVRLLHPHVPSKPWSAIYRRGIPQGTTETGHADYGVSCKDYTTADEAMRDTDANCPLVPPARG